MILLIGPCMFAAPLVVLLIPVAMVLWLPSLALVGVAWLVVWPFATLARHRGGERVTHVHAVLAEWFVLLRAPWNYFDPPKDPPNDSLTASPTDQRSAR